MKKLLMLGGRYQACREIIEYAHNNNIYIIVTDNYPIEQSFAKALADEYWMISSGDIDTLEKKCIEESIDGVICGISEYNIEQCIELSRRLGKPFYCEKEPFSFSRDKLKFRMQCDKVGVPMATYYHITPEFKKEDVDNVKFPVVVKPVDRNANRGISFCENVEELREAVKVAHETSYCGRILAERRLIGQEYFAYYAMADGQVSFLGMGAMCSQPGYPYNCYVVGSSHSKEFYHYRDEINDKLIELLKSMDCKEGYAWFELILDQDGHFYVLEMGYRLAGTLTFLSQKDVTGFDPIKWIVDISLGVKHTERDLPVSATEPYEGIYSYYSIWNKNAGTVGEIKGIDVLERIPGMYVSFVAKEGDTYEQYRHIGTVVFSAKGMDELIEKMELIRTTLVVNNEDGESMPIYFTNYAHLLEV